MADSGAEVWSSQALQASTGELCQPAWWLDELEGMCCNCDEKSGCWTGSRHTEGAKSVNKYRDVAGFG